MLGTKSAYGPTPAAGWQHEVVMNPNTKQDGPESIHVNGRENCSSVWTKLVSDCVGKKIFYFQLSHSTSYIATATVDS
jgi:hypothetical protein